MGMYDYYDDRIRPIPVNTTYPVDLSSYSGTIKDKIIIPGIGVVEKTPEPITEVQKADKDDRDQEVKHDAGKCRMELIPTSAYKALGDVLTYGAKLYGDHTWNRVDADRYVGALLRHLCRYLDDPYGYDDESGLPHIDHVFCNAMFLTHKVHEQLEKEKEEDKKE